MRPFLLFVRMAVQNLSRRRTRSLLLSLTVAIGSGAVFTAIVLRQAIQNSVSVGLARMGADLIVVPRDTTANLTAALLTVEPTSSTLPAERRDQIAGLPGVERVAPQRYFALGGPHGHDDLIAFDPHQDFTVLSWLQDKLNRELRLGDLIVGARRDEAVGESITLFGRSFTVYGKLPVTGVGPFERSLFASFETVAAMDESAQQASGRRMLGTLPLSYSGLLVRLRPGTTVEQFRFAAAELHDIKIVPGNSLYSSVRHALGTLLSGAVGLTLLMLLSTTFMVAALYCGLLAERRRELGLLLALGLRPRQLMHIILVEAALTTACGGVCGTVFGTAGIFLFERSLGFYFEKVRVPFLLPTPPAILWAASVSVLAACGIGLIGAVVPAWLAGRQQPYELVRGDG
jgi:putative ABC transport system permease protein